MERGRYRNLLRERLAGRQFVASVECVTPRASDAFESAANHFRGDDPPVVRLAGLRGHGRPR
jgi:hypothetical protein